MEIRGIMSIFGNNSIILLTGYHSKLIKRKKTHEKMNEHKMKLTSINYRKSLFIDRFSRLVEKVWRELWNLKGIGNPVIDF